MKLLDKGYMLVEKYRLQKYNWASNKGLISLILNIICIL